ncbi:MAG: hypothetical protein K0S68_166 [Candidatus Saccharibacteria bacterium]|jgi:plastocyanin|nr:hypothetical protein [Candidatus Saccharibacteria bacterium]
MKRSTVTAIVIVLALIILGALFYQASQRTATVTSPSPSPSDRPSAAASPSASPLSSSPATSTAPVTVDFTSTGFSPKTVNVTSGTTITFKNSTAEDVQPSSDPHPQHTINPELNVGVISAGQSKTITVNQKGSYGMHNHFDPTDTLSVVVQ